MKSRVLSFDKLIRSSRTPSATFKSDLGYSSLLSFRSKSYHDELDRLSRPSISRGVSTLSNYRSSSIRDFFTSSLSAHDLSRSDILSVDGYNGTSINAYAKHYSHHESSIRESRLTSRNRFKTRTALRAARSHSAERSIYTSPVRDATQYLRPFDLSLPRMSRSLHDLTSRARSISRISVARDFATPLLSNSYHNFSIRGNRHLNDLPTSSADWMYDIMNKPDFYLRRMKNLRESRSAPKRWSDSSHQSYYDGSDVTQRYNNTTGDRSIYKINRYDRNYGSNRNRIPSLFTSRMRGNIFH